MQENIREMLRSFQILCKLKTDIRYIMSYLGRATVLLNTLGIRQFGGNCNKSQFGLFL